MMGGAAAYQVANLYAAPRYGLIASYNPNLYRVKVTLAPSADGVNPLTGYMPLFSPWVGNGWGIVCPPLPGEQHGIVFVQSNPDQPLATGRFYDMKNLPPKRADGQPAEGAEFVLVHRSGSRLEFTNDQKVLVNGQVELDLSSPQKVVITAPQVVINGDVTVNGTVTASGEGSFNGGHTVSQHKHGGVASGGANTATPQG
jgi:phage baseplate assembly protein gpV